MFSIAQPEKMQDNTLSISCSGKFEEMRTEKKQGCIEAMEKVWYDVGKHMIQNTLVTIIFLPIDSI